MSTSPETNEFALFTARRSDQPTTTRFTDEFFVRLRERAKAMTVEEINFHRAQLGFGDPSSSSHHQREAESVNATQPSEPELDETGKPISPSVGTVESAFQRMELEDSQESEHDDTIFSFSDMDLDVDDDEITDHDNSVGNVTLKRLRDVFAEQFPKKKKAKLNWKPENSTVREPECYEGLGEGLFVVPKGRRQIRRPNGRATSSRYLPLPSLPTAGEPATPPRNSKGNLDFLASSSPIGQSNPEENDGDIDIDASMSDVDSSPRDLGMYTFCPPTHTNPSRKRKYVHTDEEDPLSPLTTPTKSTGSLPYVYDYMVSSRQMKARAPGSVPVTPVKYGPSVSVKKAHREARFRRGDDHFLWTVGSGSEKSKANGIKVV